MSRVLSSTRMRAQQTLVLTLSGLLFAATSASAAELPPCAEDRTHDCVLPDWSAAEQRDLPSLFGEIAGTVWLEDEPGDAPTGGIDILAAGLGRVDITDPGPVRKSDALRKQGKLKEAVRKGEAIVARIVLDRPLDETAGGHASVHLATDIKGSRSNNVPSGVAAPDFPFAGSQDVYSVAWASTTGKTRLLASDLAKDWYKSKRPFAASWAAPDVLDLLIRPSALGESFRVITHASGGKGGYDTLTLGPVAIPADGVVGLVPACIEGSISVEPFVVRRLVENGQTVRDVEAPASWRGGAVLPVEEEVRAALERLIAERDEDGDGRAGLLTWVNLFEDGLVIRQRPQLQLSLEGDQVVLALELGLTRRGYNVLRDFEVESTGDAALDAWFERATDALREGMPPFRLGKKGGLLIGESIGACVPWLEPPPAPAPDPSESPAAAG